jgi:glycerophosphoryl diester phosphodiesterase
MSAAATLAALALAVPGIHAHRGGTVSEGVPTFGEETLPAFQHAWESERAVLELDVKLSADRVPVVIHDATLEATTACEGRVDARTWAQLAECPVDILGSPDSTLPTAPAPAPIPLARLSDVLAYARDAGASVNLEIKNIPTDPDFDTTPGYTNTVMDVVKASRLPLDRLIVQSFWPPNLDAARTHTPRVTLSLLTLAQGNDAGPDFAAQQKYHWVSPAWPVDKAYVDRAHALKLKVVPYTIDDAEGVKAAAAAGVDALITNDPIMARKALGLPEPATGGPGDAGTSAGDKPRVRIRSASLARRRVVLRIRASVPVRLRLTVRDRRGRVVARGGGRVSEAGTVRLRLTARGRRTTPRRWRLRGTATADGQTVKVRRALKLRQ